MVLILESVEEYSKQPIADARLRKRRGTCEGSAEPLAVWEWSGVFFNRPLSDLMNRAALSPRRSQPIEWGCAENRAAVEDAEGILDLG